MTIQQLRYVLEVMKTGSISIASKNLYVTQAGISQSITNLEKELGVTFFDRQRSGCTLTLEGENLIQDIIELVNKAEEIKEKAKTDQKLLSGNLKVSATPSLFMTILADILPLFKKDYPKVNLEVSVNILQDVIQDVNNGKVDIGFGIIDESLNYMKNLTFQTISSDNLYACVSKNSPFANYKTISAKQISNYPVVLANGVYMRSQMKKLFGPSGPANILFESNNNEVLKRAISDNLAMGFFIGLALQDDPYILNGNIIRIPLADFASEAPYGWIRLNNKYMSLPEKNLLKYVEYIIQERYSNVSEQTI